MHLPVIGHARIPARKKTVFDEGTRVYVALNAMASDKPNVRKSRLAKAMRGISADRHDPRAGWVCHYKCHRLSVACTARSKPPPANPQKPPEPFKDYRND